MTKSKAYKILRKLYENKTGNTYTSIEFNDIISWVKKENELLNKGQIGLPIVGIQIPAS